MKTTSFAIILLLVFAFLACDSSNNGGVVAQDGPILESINAKGNLEFNGAVINTGDSPVKSVYVVIILKDQNGKVIETNSVSIFGNDPNALLYPSERAFFTMTVASDPNRMFSKDVEIYYDDASNSPSTS